MAASKHPEHIHERQRVSPGPQPGPDDDHGRSGPVEFGSWWPSGSPRVGAGQPALAAQYLATLLVLHPAAGLMARRGRRPVFVGAALVGLRPADGGTGHSPRQSGLFVVAGLCIGVLGGVGQFYRFAAIEAVAPASAGLAVSLTLTGGVLAAFLGPWLARSTRTCSARLSSRASWCWPGWPWRPAGRAATAGCAARAAVQGPAGEADPGRPCGAGRGSGGGYGVNLLMTATPLAMWHRAAIRCHRHGDPVASGGHVAPSSSPAAWRPDRCPAGDAHRRPDQPRRHCPGAGGRQLRPLPVVPGGVGLGWNLLYVGATTLLAEHWRAEEKGRVQAVNDSLVFLG
jgi:hypothetical protein